MPDLPDGTVTFLFTDIEGSTRLWEQDQAAMQTALARHDTLMRRAIEQHDGVVFKTIGDAFCAAFASAPNALSASFSAQTALNTEDWTPCPPLRARIALHTGCAEQRDGDYFGVPLNRIARLLAIGYGGQTLLSRSAEENMRGSAGSLPDGLQFRDRGLHRLRDLSVAEHVFELLHPDLPSDFPPLRSLLPTQTNLPVQTTSFIGREKECAEVRLLFQTRRLLTLTGSGGTGKTRLMLQIAADYLEAIEDGVWLIELAPLSDPDLVPQAVANALGIREEPGRPLTPTLIETLRTKKMLLLLDNCEHLLSTCAILTDMLLKQCPGIRILATSREGLGVAGEQTYRVPSLSLPDQSQTPTVANFADCEAVSLFVERAKAANQSFVLTDANASFTADICRRLDGIPLAIELAAARVQGMSVEQIEARLHDRFRLLTGGSRTALPRQQTLRAIIDWSYNLLTEDEKRLFLRLSVFSGGWTIEAAEAICSDKVSAEDGCDKSLAGDIVETSNRGSIEYDTQHSPLEEWQILDLLIGLVDKSLVVFEEQEGTGRYHLLETVRQYAREKLADSNEGSSVRGQHRDYYAALTAENVVRENGPEAAAVFRLLALEHDNLRAALEWFASDPEGAEGGLELAASLWRFWEIRGYWREGREHLLAALARPEVSEPTSSRAAALCAAGNLISSTCDYLGAAVFYRESLAAAQQAGDLIRVSYVTNQLGIVAQNLDDNEGALTLFHEAIALHKSLQDLSGQSIALSNMGVALLNLERLEEARDVFNEALEVQRTLGDQRSIAISLNNLGDIAQQEGDFSVAHALQQASFQITLDMGNKRGAAYAIESFASLACAQGQWERAAGLWGAANAVRRAAGAPLTPYECGMQARASAQACAAFGEASFTAAFAVGDALTVERAFDYVLAASAPVS